VRISHGGCGRIRRVQVGVCRGPVLRAESREFSNLADGIPSANHHGSTVRDPGWRGYSLGLDPTEAETQPSRAQVQEPGAGS